MNKIDIEFEVFGEKIWRKKMSFVMPTAYRYIWYISTRRRRKKK